MADGIAARGLLPASVFGPVLLSALRRLASICLYEVMASAIANKLALLSNCALLVNDLFDLALYAGSRVVSAVGIKPPHDGRSRVRPPRVLCAVRIGRNEPTGMASPTSRQGHRDTTSEGGTNTVNLLFDLWCS